MNDLTRRISKGYLPTLDGWRCLAILAVIFNHDRVRTIGGSSLAGLRWDGHHGVDLFFAISGILICTRLLEEEKVSGISLKSFYIRRLFRIQPAAMTYLAAISLLMAFNVLRRAPDDVLAAALMVRNYFPVNHSPDAWYTAHFWSLAVEEHFYLFLPGFLVLFRRRRAAILAGILALLEAWRIFVLSHPRFIPEDVEIHTDFAVWGILFASLTALLLREPRVRLWAERWLMPGAALVIMAGIWILIHFEKDELTHLLFECSFSLVIISTMLHPSTLSGRILESAPLRFIGRISYSLYLWQMLFFQFFYALRPPRLPALVFLQNSGWRFVAVFGVSLLSYYFIEKPMIRVGHRIAAPPIPDREDLSPPLRPAFNRLRPE